MLYDRSCPISYIDCFKEEGGDEGAHVGETDHSMRTLRQPAETPLSWGPQGEIFLSVIGSQIRLNIHKHTFLSETADWKGEVGGFSTANQGAKWKHEAERDVISDTLALPLELLEKPWADAQRGSLQGPDRLRDTLNLRQLYPRERDKKRVMRSRCDTTQTHIHTRGTELMTCQGRRNLSLCNGPCCKKLWLVDFVLFLLSSSPLSQQLWMFGSSSLRAENGRK